MEYLGRTADGAVVMNRPTSHLHHEMEEILSDALSRVMDIKKNLF